MIAIEVSSSLCSPNVIVPRHCRDTCRPLRPSRTCSMTGTLSPCPRPGYVPIPEKDRFRHPPQGIFIPNGTRGPRPLPRYGPSPDSKPGPQTELDPDIVVV